jgi:hypothetical protein
MPRKPSLGRDTKVVQVSGSGERSRTIRPRSRPTIISPGFLLGGGILGRPEVGRQILDLRTLSGCRTIGALSCRDPEQAAGRGPIPRNAVMRANASPQGNLTHDNVLIMREMYGREGQ